MFTNFSYQYFEIESKSISNIIIYKYRCLFMRNTRVYKSTVHI